MDGAKANVRIGRLHEPSLTATTAGGGSVVGEAIMAAETVTRSATELATVLEQDHPQDAAVREAAALLRQTYSRTTREPAALKAIIEDRWINAVMTSEKNEHGTWEPMTSELYDQLYAVLSRIAVRLVSFEASVQDIDVIATETIEAASDRMCDWALRYLTGQSAAVAAA